MPALPLLRDAEPRRRNVTSQSRSRSARPGLRVVQRRRRWPAVVATVLWLAVSVGLLGAAVFHTQLAGRQLRIDRLERAVTEQRELFDDLRYQRAELRSPVRLAEEAGALGMQRGSTGNFVEIDPMRLARQLAAAGSIDERAVQIIIDTDPLDQFRDVKSVTAGQP